MQIGGKDRVTENDRHLPSVFQPRGGFLPGGLPSMRSEPLLFSAYDLDDSHHWLRNHDVTDLDVHIDVLRKQLQREGLA